MHGRQGHRCDVPDPDTARRHRGRGRVRLRRYLALLVGAVFLLLLTGGGLRTAERGVNALLGEAGPLRSLHMEEGRAGMTRLHLMGTAVDVPVTWPPSRTAREAVRRIFRR